MTAPTMTFATVAARQHLPSLPDCEPAGRELTGRGLHRAIVYCTLADLNEQHFRNWLWDDVATRFGPDAHQPPITLEVIP